MGYEVHGLVTHDLAVGSWISYPIIWYRNTHEGFVTTCGESPLYPEPRLDAVYGITYYHVLCHLCHGVDGSDGLSDLEIWI